MLTATRGNRHEGHETFNVECKFNFLCNPCNMFYIYIYIYCFPARAAAGVEGSRFKLAGVAPDRFPVRGRRMGKGNVKWGRAITLGLYDANTRITDDEEYPCPYTSLLRHRQHRPLFQPAPITIPPLLSTLS